MLGSVKEHSYRVDPTPQLKSCSKCGIPTLPARLVYSKTGDLICAACESGTDGEVRIVRGAWGSVGAAIALGFVGTIALLLLLQSAVEIWSNRPSRAEVRLGTLWELFLAMLVGLGGWTIAGAHRTLSSPAVRKAIGPKRAWMLLLSWAGIPLVPAIAVLWVVAVAILRMVTR
jgi:hypothetical protein